MARFMSAEVSKAHACALSNQNSSSAEKENQRSYCKRVKSSAYGPYGYGYGGGYGYGAGYDLALVTTLFLLPFLFI